MNDMNLEACEEELLLEMKAHNTTKLLLWKERTYVWACSVIFFLYLLAEFYFRVKTQDSTFWMVIFWGSAGIVMWSVFQWITARSKVREYKEIMTY